jgi:MYXO-CTERM domain-containing protein
VPNPLVAPLLRFARRLRFPTLFFATATLFVATLVIPDPIPLIDELLFGLATLLLAALRQRQRPADDATDR